MKRQTKLVFTSHTLKISCSILCLIFAAAVFGLRLRPADAAGDAQQRLAPQSPSAENQAPELVPIRIKHVGLGQRIYFGLGAIDEEGDDVRIELMQKPASAKYNAKTLTVDWTPKPSDDPKGMFVVRVTEYPLDKKRQPRAGVKTFNIPVEPKPVEILSLPPASLEVNALVSIIDPERLIAANERWTIIKLFDRIADIEAEKQITSDNKISRTTGAALFHDALKNLSALHHNEEIDPDSPEFNQQWQAANWQLTAVRPRINKKVFELRLVYFNVVAAEPAYLMVRMRIVRGKDVGRPDELRQKNNRAFIKLFYDAFFDGEALKPFVANDKKKYGEALADFISGVLNYKDPQDPMMRANFAALPHNARLGGDNTYDAKGNYLTGDGWALGVMKVAPVERDGKRVLAFINSPIDGFATSIAVNAEGNAYKPVPAPRFDPESKSFAPGWDKLIDADDHGNIDIPDVAADGSVKASNIDSSSTARDYKFKYMVAETPLRDPRRRLFEERGMTCIQCHVRNFDEGDPLAPVFDPKQRAKMGETHEIERVPFVIIPSLGEGRSEYTRRIEAEQVGSLQGAIRDYLGIEVNINSPLASDWPFDTRRGRN